MALLQVFGEFEMTIDGRKVEWLRRRDRQIVEYLSLRPEGSASRAQVIAAFWADADPHLASQSLRTACSTIRRAIAQCVGYDRVGNYFSVSRDLTLHFENVVTTSKRFVKHIETADNAHQRNDDAVARAHYLAALRLYRAPLLNSEGVPAPWFEAEALSMASAAARAHKRSLREPTDGTTDEKRRWVAVNKLASP